MTKYYGFMVSELTGEVDNLECDVDYKPPHESCGFSFAKWFTGEEKRDKCKEYTKKAIKEIQENGHKGLRVRI